MGQYGNLYFRHGNSVKSSWPCFFSSRTRFEQFKWHLAAFAQKSFESNYECKLTDYVIFWWPDVDYANIDSKTDSPTLSHCKYSHHKFSSARWSPWGEIIQMQTELTMSNMNFDFLWKANTFRLVSVRKNLELKIKWRNWETRRTKSCKKYSQTTRMIWFSCWTVMNP